MKRWMMLGLLVCAMTPGVRAEVSGDIRRSGRYEMFISPQGNRVYVLDSQAGRLFQLVNYKEINKEILEEIPYVFGSTRLCTPSEFEYSNDRCFNRNYEYIKTLLDVKREQAAPPPPAAATPAKAQ